MPVESAADRAVFVNPDEFGVTATYGLAGGGSSTIDGIFDDGYRQAFDGPGIASDQPRFIVRQADLPAGYGKGDSVTIDGTEFEVAVIERDGTGMVVLALTEV